MKTKTIVLVASAGIVGILFGGIILKFLQDKIVSPLFNKAAIDTYGKNPVFNALTAEVKYGTTYEKELEYAGGGATIMQDTEGNPVVIPLVGVGA